VRYLLLGVQKVGPLLLLGVWCTCREFLSFVVFAKTKINLPPTQKTTTILTTNPANGGSPLSLIKELANVRFQTLICRCCAFSVCLMGEGGVFFKFIYTVVCM
jgi:hypothetical protein